MVRTEKHRIICIADLPPSAPTKSRYLVKRLRAAVPEVKILVGRWGPPLFADGSEEALRAAGADTVTAQLIEARDVLVQLHASLPAEPAAA